MKIMIFTWYMSVRYNYVRKLFNWFVVSRKPNKHFRAIYNWRTFIPFGYGYIYMQHLIYVTYRNSCIRGTSHHANKLLCVLFVFVTSFGHWSFLKIIYILERWAYKERDVTYLEKESKTNYCNFVILLLLLLVIQQCLLFNYNFGMLHTAYTHLLSDISAIPNMANKCTQNVCEYYDSVNMVFWFVVVAGKNNLNLNIIEIGQVLQW